MHDSGRVRSEERPRDKRQRSVNRSAVNLPPGESHGEVPLIEVDIEHRHDTFSTKQNRRAGIVEEKLFRRGAIVQDFDSHPSPQHFVQAFVHGR